MKKKEIPMWAQLGHGRPVTRREMLSTGLLPFAAAITMPSWIDFFRLPEAKAADLQCQGNQPSDLSAFITVNLAGGASLGANYVPTQANGDLLNSYKVMGLGVTAKLPIEREFGNVPFAGMVQGRLISQFLAGLRVGAPSALSKTAFLALCTRTRDDSLTNTMCIDGLLYKAGLKGTLLPNIGQRNTQTGINQAAAVLIPPTPLRVTSLASMTGALNYSASLGSRLSVKQRQDLARLISNLSESQTRRLASMDAGSALKTAIDCAGVHNINMAQTGSELIDPRRNKDFVSEFYKIWGVNSSTLSDDRDLVFGAITYNALKGQCGSAGLVMSGYDYHDDTRTTGDERDFIAGQAIGRMLETALALGKPLTVYVCTDGHCSSAYSESYSSSWISDRGTAGVSYMLMFDPKGRPKTTGFQIGSFTNGQVAAENTPVGSRMEAAATSIFANYLAFNGKMDRFDSIAGRILSRPDLQTVLKVA